MRSAISRFCASKSINFMPIRFLLSHRTSSNTHACGTAGDDRARRYVVYDQRSCANQRTGTDVNTAHDDGSTSDRCALPDYRGFHLPIARALRYPVGRGCPRIAIVNEDDAVANKHLVIYGHSRTDKGMT